MQHVARVWGGKKIVSLKKKKEEVEQPIKQSSHAILKIGLTWHIPWYPQQEVPIPVLYRAHRAIAPFESCLFGQFPGLRTKREQNASFVGVLFCLYIF